jgi:hypothetical protein
MGLKRMLLFHRNIDRRRVLDQYVAAGVLHGQDHAAGTFKRVIRTRVVTGIAYSHIARYRSLPIGIVNGNPFDLDLGHGALLGQISFGQYAVRAIERHQGRCGFELCGLGDASRFGVTKCIAGLVGRRSEARQGHRQCDADGEEPYR